MQRGDRTSVAGRPRRAPGTISPSSLSPAARVGSRGVAVSTEALIEIRASQLRANLEEINRMPEPGRSEIRRLIGEATLEDIANSASVAWLPVEYDMTITRAVVDVLGHEGNRRWARDALLRSATGPLLKPVFDGARAVFGVSPHALYRIIPRGFGLIYRGAGEVEYEQLGERHARLVHAELPALLSGAPWYLEGIAGAFEAGYAIFGGQGDVDLVVDPVARTATYEVRWNKLSETAHP